jgi:biopolymer transport protein ExbD
MKRLRRERPEARLEMMPLLDVVFLLLTFFIFSLVLMVRADVLNVRPPTLTAGEAATGGQTITIAIDAEDTLFVNREEVAPDDLVARVRALREEDEDARLFVAADERSSSGALIGVVDRLVAAEIGEFSVVGRPSEGGGEENGGE